MTQNEAKVFVANKDNWHVIGVTEYARIIRLQYKSLYYIFDQEHDCIGYACRPTQMANEIWQESKRNNK